MITYRCRPLPTDGQHRPAGRQSPRRHQVPYRWPRDASKPLSCTHRLLGSSADGNGGSRTAKLRAASVTTLSCRNAPNSKPSIHEWLGGAVTCDAVGALPCSIASAASSAVASRSGRMSAMRAMASGIGGDCMMSAAMPTSRRAAAVIAIAGGDLIGRVASRFLQRPAQ